MRIFKKFKKNTEMKQNLRVKLKAALIIVTAQAVRVPWTLVRRLREHLASTEASRVCDPGH